MEEQLARLCHGAVESVAKARNQQTYHAYVGTGVLVSAHRKTNPRDRRNDGQICEDHAIMIKADYFFTRVLHLRSSLSVFLVFFSSSAGYDTPA